MPVCKCKTCGGTIPYQQGDRTGVCEYCGTEQPLPFEDESTKSDGSFDLNDTLNKVSKKVGTLFKDVTDSFSAGFQTEAKQSNTTESNTPGTVIAQENRDNDAESHNAESNSVSSSGHSCNKWISLLLCFFLGIFGAHKFYEGKIALGIVYLLTGGLFYIGAIIDFFIILGKPDTYIVTK